MSRELLVRKVSDEKMDVNLRKIKEQADNSGKLSSISNATPRRGDTVSKENISPMDGNVIRGIEISTSGTEIEHRLGRLYTGFIPTNLNAHAIICDDSDSGDLSNVLDKTKKIKLKSSATVTADVWFF